MLSRCPPTARSPSPAARRRSTSSTSRACARPRRSAFDRDPGGTTAYGTSVGYVPLREWIAEKHGVDGRAGDRHQRLDAGRRVPVRAARRSRRRRRRREADLRPHAARPAQARRRHPDGRAAARRHRHRRRRGAARGRRAPDARAHHPQLPEPGRLHAVGRQARARCSRSPRSTASRSSRTTPTSTIRFTGEPLPTMLSQDDGGQGRLRLVVLEDRLPGHPLSATSSGPQALIAQIQGLATNTYISPNMVAQSIVYEFCAPAASTASIATVKAGAARAPRDARHRARSASCPRRSFAPPEGGYFMWVELPEGNDVARAVRDRGRARRRSSSRARTSCSRAARTRCGSPTPASRPSRSTRASRGSPRRRGRWASPPDQRP